MDIDSNAGCGTSSSESQCPNATVTSMVNVQHRVNLSFYCTKQKLQALEKSCKIVSLMLGRTGLKQQLESDILGRTLNPHRADPRLAPSALEERPTLYGVNGFNAYRENIDVQHWGSTPATEGTRVETANVRCVSSSKLQLDEILVKIAYLGQLES